MDGLSIVGVQQIHRVVEVVEEAVKGHAVRLLGQGVRPALDLPKIRRNALIEIVPISMGCLNRCDSSARGCCSDALLLLLPASEDDVCSNPLL